MPTLDFKGKQFVYAHHLSVPFRELRVEAKKSLPAKGKKPALDDNLIIHGDNHNRWNVHQYLQWTAQYASGHHQTHRPDESGYCGRSHDSSSPLLIPAVATD